MHLPVPVPVQILNQIHKVPVQTQAQVRTLVPVQTQAQVRIPVQVRTLAMLVHHLKLDNLKEPMIQQTLIKTIF